MARKTRYFDSSDTEIPAAQALDAQGLLRDGVRAVVRMTAKDARPRSRFSDARALYDSGTVAVTDGDATLRTANSAGWRVSDASIRQGVHQARDAYIADLENAYKNDRRTVDARTCPDCDGDGEIDGEQCERCEGSGELDAAADACGGRKVKRYNAAGQSEGTWKEEEPDEASDHRTLTVDALQARRDAAVAPARESMIAETVNAWRRNK